MATEGQRIYDRSFFAAADLSAKQFFIVELTASQTVNACNAATDIPVGVLQNDPKSGEEATVREMGVTKVVSDGTTPIAIGDFVGTNNAGKAVKKTTDKDYIIGRAESASSADGVIITVDMAYRGWMSV